MRLAAVIFVAIHGIGHIVWFFSTWTQRVLGKEGRAQLQARRGDFLVEPRAVAGRTVGILSLLVVVGFITAAWGIWNEAVWWPPLLIGSAIASVVVVSSMWNPIKAPGPVPISVRALLADIGLGAAALMPWGERFLGAHR
jgi:hypothetical protein